MPSPPLIPKKNLPQIHKCFPISWSKSLHSPPSTTPSEKKRDELKPPPSPATPLIDSINSLSAHGHLSEACTAFSLLLRPHSSSPRLLVRPLTYLLSCFTAQRALPQGQQLHALVLSLGLSDNPYLVFKLTSLYSAFDLLADARAVVEGAIKMQTLPWNLLLSAYVRNGCWEDAILAYKQMVERGVRVDKFTYSAILKACGEMRELELGRDIHRRIYGSGLEWDLYVWNALVALYVKCGALELARKVFDGMAERDVVTWNSMISGYASKGMWEEAFQLLEQMPETVKVNTVTWNTIIAGNLQMSNFMEVLRLISQMRMRGSTIDYVTLVIGLKACSRLGSVRMGKEIHGLAIRFHCEKLENVKNALITMYSRCKNTGNAYILFRTSATWSLITWNAMMAGFVHIDQAEEACLLFREMIGCRIWPNYVTVTTVLSLCARVANLQHGRELHCYVTKLGFEGYQSLWNSLVDMYSKSGRMAVAQRVFDFMKGRDKISYTSLIAGYGLQGKGITSLKLFNEMIDCGIEPDHITMVAVLSACSHSGLVTQGQMIFSRMVGLYGIVAQVEHYSCMVDLYGRAGLLRKAEEIIDQMPLQPSSAMLATLVEACRVHGNIEIGERAAKKLLEMKSDNPSHYVLIANMYASARRWQELAKVRILMRDMGIQKAPSCSWLDLGNNLYPFQVDSTSKQQLWKRFRGSDKPPPNLGPSRAYNVDMVLKIHKVPATDMEALKSPLMGLFEKRRAQKFFIYIWDYDENDPKTHGGPDLTRVTTRELILKHGLDDNTVDFIGHALALHRDDRYLDEPALDTVKTMKLYAESLAYFQGGSPYIHPLYGLGEPPQAFACLSAVYGGTYMINKPEYKVEFDVEGKVCGVTSDGEIAKCKKVECDPFYLPNKVRKVGKVARAIAITSHPIRNTDDSRSVQVILPQKQLGRKSDMSVFFLEAPNGFMSYLLNSS